LSNLTYLRSDLDEIAGATISVTNEDSTYMKENLQSEPVSEPYRSTTDSDIDIDIDLGSAKSLDFAALVNHNITSSATVTLYAGTSSSPSTNANVFTWKKFDMFRYLSSPLNFRYWRIRVQDSTNPDTYISVGRALLGATSVFTKNYRRLTRSPIYINARYASDMLSPSVVALARVYSLGFEWSVLTKAQADEITGAVDALSGDASPVFVVPDTDVNEGYYGRFGPYSETSELLDFRSISLPFIEDGRGRAIAA
jgi:hypothetical protein